MHTYRKFAVAGATGRVGTHVSAVLRERGHEVVPMSRATGVDVITGAGLDEALQGVDCIIDVATGPSAEQQPATEFFTTAARNLQQAGQRAVVKRIVVVSIIGIDRFTGGYSAAKLDHERAMLAGPIPARVVRAAQFHEFVPQLLQWGTQGDVLYVPPMRTQAVAARHVAEVLVDQATSSEAGSTSKPYPEVAGPRVEYLPDLAHMWVARRGGPSHIEVADNPMDPDRELYKSDVLLPGPSAILGGPTFAEWLDRLDGR
jgi:uncharacterized protein YbjT (DUF2867 family)